MKDKQVGNNNNKNYIRNEPDVTKKVAYMF